MTNHSGRVAIIGSGPSALYVLWHILQRLDQLQQHTSKITQIIVFEKDVQFGTGMPYNPRTTDRYNICNISSEELPKLTGTFANWLQTCQPLQLHAWNIEPDDIRADETYCRIALGQYFHEQWNLIVSRLRNANVTVIEHPLTQITDVIDDPARFEIKLIDSRGYTYDCDRLVIATGHAFGNNDIPECKYFQSPWPIQKLLPEVGTFYNFKVGTLGASLSAFDVITSLAHRHGRFLTSNQRTTFKRHPEATGFGIVMHDLFGWLPHLQYEQRQPFRDIYRHTSRQDVFSLLDEKGFLQLQDYFNSICRPALIKAFQRDARPEVVEKLKHPEFTIDDFVTQMTSEHTYSDPFAGMRQELKPATRSVQQDRPIHWKEVLDDLMYTLNFHAELLSAEDHLHFHAVVMPFLMNVIAALPLRSAKILLALHEAGCLELVVGSARVVGHEDEQTLVEVEHDCTTHSDRFKMFVDCSGQSPLTLENYPFTSLRQSGRVRSARVPFHDSSAPHDLKDSDRDRLLPGDPPCLELAGIDVDAFYRLRDLQGTPNPRIHDIAFPHTTGLRPYSYGLQACNDTAAILVSSWCHPQSPSADTAQSLSQASTIYDQI